MKISFALLIIVFGLLLVKNTSASSLNITPVERNGSGRYSNTEVRSAQKPSAFVNYGRANNVAANQYNSAPPTQSYSPQRSPYQLQSAYKNRPAQENYQQKPVSQDGNGERIREQFKQPKAPKRPNFLTKVVQGLILQHLFKIPVAGAIAL